MSRLWVKIKNVCDKFGACLKGQKQKIAVLCQQISTYAQKVDEYTQPLPPAEPKEGTKTENVVQVSKQKRRRPRNKVPFRD